jgi:hypothetical protein
MEVEFAQREQWRFPPPKWKQLYAAAMLELDSTKLPQRIAEAYQAILNRVEDLHMRSPEGEQHALNDAVRNLRILRKMSEVESDGLSTTGT